MWRKNLSVLSVVAILLLSACGNDLKKPLVKPVLSKVDLPTKNEINSITLASAGIGRMIMVPRNPSLIKDKIESWFKAASPVSVTFPNSKVNDNGKGDRNEPAMLILHLNSGKLMLLSQTSYLVKSSKGIKNQPVKGIVSYTVGNKGKTKYLKAPDLYQWLKDNKYQSQFKDMKS